MEITQKAIIIDRIVNDEGQRVCLCTSYGLSCLFYHFNGSLDICIYTGDELSEYEETEDMKPSDNCPLWN